MSVLTRACLTGCSARMTAEQCVAHPWLKRRAPPPVVPLPPPSVPIVVAEPPSPPPLEVTKDNLRTFVERWGEHPNSPYVFDPACHSISLSSIAHMPSMHSMRMCTPSPQGSLPSSPDSVLELDPSEDFAHYSFQDGNTPTTHGRFLDRLNLDRRASDSSCLPNRGSHHQGHQVSSVNLAEEIRRLSDRLCRMVAEIPADIVNNNERGGPRRVSHINSRDVPLGAPSPAAPATPSSPLRSLSSSSGTSQSLPSSPTRLSPEPTPPTTRELVLHLQESNNTSRHSQQSETTVTSSSCHTMRWGQIEINMDHMGHNTIKSKKCIFESSSSEFNRNNKEQQKRLLPFKLS